MKSLFTKKKKEIQDIQNTPSIPQIEAFNVEEFLNFFNTCLMTPQLPTNCKTILRKLKICFLSHSIER